MKALLTLLLVFLSITFVYAQEEEDTYNCGWNKNLSVKERNTIFPFNKAKKVVLLAYPNHLFMIDNVNQDSLDIAGASKYYDSHVLNKWVIEHNDRKSIYFSTEEVKLTGKGINKLSNLLFNYTTDKKLSGPITINVAGCYEPRNAMLFFDKNDEVIACIEICFECNAVNVLKGESKFLDEAILEFRLDSDSCYDKHTLLREFFIEQGIKFGAVTVD